MQLTQMIKRNAALYPDNTATLCGGRHHSWTELRERVAKAASLLRQCGVGEGDRVAVLSLNSDRYYEQFFAVPWAGAVLVPLNIRWSVKESLYALKDSGARVLVVDDAFLPAAEAVLAGDSEVERVIHIGDLPTPEAMVEYDAALAGLSPMADAGRGGEALAGIYYTGGTTGFPKGVMLSHHNLWISSVSASLGLTLCRPDVRYLHAAPMFHAADIAMSYATTICGATQVFIPAFDCQAVVDSIAEHRVTHTLLVPTMVTMLLGAGVIPGADLASLDTIVYGASPMPEGTLRQALAELPGVEFIQAYGQTEMAPLITILAARFHVVEGPEASRLRSAGQAVACVELEVVDPLGGPLPCGQVGEVRVRGGNAMKGYWNRPDESAEVMRDGWIHTGDAGYLDEEGFLFLVDRVKDMIISGGENVYSAEVESALSRHPAVAEVAVIGIPSERWGEQVHALVRLKPGQALGERELIDFCHQAIAGYKCPRSVEFRPEPFPITGAGKLRKADLRAPYWEGHRRRVN
ncbi:long-chain-fatty-acid--CoA ligase [Ferrimonas sediminicola]|uniref:Long-chain-fatty-acid--CoA ligase n=1 Tax=Ferrimonas sediminicola TaxID=2569538 RepID=A0A4U1BHZ9_9GAMM|nr:long-chain-fatty-acid--CoA ligase [Ferrimonas sediminicola]TKB50396.1 long-chain-fatty-acid--CoA ligase [Ferrimonas sediminicola]